MRLQDLIHRRKTELGLTYNKMVERAEAAGYPISRSMFHHLADDTWANVPTTDKIRGVAAAIEVSPDEVLLAAAESLGLQTQVYDLGRTTRAMIAMLEGRSESQQALLADIMRKVVSAMEQPLDESNHPENESDKAD